MPGPDDGLGKEAEKKLKTWLDKPSEGYSFDRLPDQMTGYYIVSRNICDFICYKYPNVYYIESKSTWSDRFDFNMITETQYRGLLAKSKIEGCFGLVTVLFASYQRAFILDIKDIDYSICTLKSKSLNIKKIAKWKIPSIEIPTIKSRKEFLDYEGDFQFLVNQLNTIQQTF